MLGAGHAAAGPARVETQVRRPFNTDRLPLNHSGNSGVRGRPKRGLMQAVLQVTNYGTLPSPTLAQDCSPLFALFGTSPTSHSGLFHHGYGVCRCWGRMQRRRLPASSAGR